MFQFCKRALACFLFLLFTTFITERSSFAQTGNLLIITQDSGANSASGLDNIIDIYSVSSAGFSPGYASLLNTITVNQMYVSGNGAQLPGDEAAIPIITNTPDFGIARVDAPTGAVTGLASTGSYLGGPLVLSNLTGCPQLGGSLLANYYTASSNYGLALVDSYSGNVNTNALPQNSELQYFQVPVQSALDCSAAMPSLYRIVETSSFFPGFPTYSVESYTYSPGSNSFAPSNFIPGTQNPISGIQVVIGGWIAVISQSSNATIKFYDPSSLTPTVPVFTHILPPGVFPLQGMNAYDASSYVLYTAVGNYAPGATSSFDIYYFDFNSFTGNTLGVYGIVPRPVQSSIASITIQ